MGKHRVSGRRWEMPLSGISRQQIAVSVTGYGRTLSLLRTVRTVLGGRVPGPGDPPGRSCGAPTLVRTGFLAPHGAQRRGTFFWNCAQRGPRPAPGQAAGWAPLEGGGAWPDWCARPREPPACLQPVPGPRLGRALGQGPQPWGARRSPHHVAGDPSLHRPQPLPQPSAHASPAEGGPGRHGRTPAQSSQPGAPASSAKQPLVWLGETCHPGPTGGRSPWG